MKKFTWSKIDNDFYAYYGDEELGYIDFYPTWRKWVWNQGEDVILSKDCIECVLIKLRSLEDREEN